MFGKTPWYTGIIIYKWLSPVDVTAWACHALAAGAPLLAALLLVRNQKLLLKKKYVANSVNTQKYGS